MERFGRIHPDPELRLELADWYEDHPDSSLADAVGDLGLWRNPDDLDAQWLAWRCLPAEAKHKLRPEWPDAPADEGRAP